MKESGFIALASDPELPNVSVDNGDDHIVDGPGAVDEPQEAGL